MPVRALKIFKFCNSVSPNWIIITPLCDFSHDKFAHDLERLSFTDQLSNITVNGCSSNFKDKDTIKFHRFTTHCEEKRCI